MPPPGKRTDPHTSSSFKVEVDNIEVATFRKVSGLKSETEIFEYQEGGNNETIHKLIGQTKHSNLILSVGFTADPSFYKWRDEVHTSGGSGKISRRNGAIVQLDRDGKTEISRWNFQKAWPVRWEMSDFDTSSGQATIETIELAVERIVKA
jgi:phage tail-like protein